MKKKASRKIIVTIIITLMIISLLMGTIGLLESKKDKTKKPDKKEDYKITYKYYLDGEEVEEMPVLEEIENPNPDFEGAIDEIPKYKFERHACTNNVTGEFDEEKWEFIPDLTNNTTCRLYFLNTTHEVIIKASNGKLPSNNLEDRIKVELEKEGIINVIPQDGYKFEDVTCTNDTLAEYNSETKDLKITNVKKDSTCSISFTISDFTAEVTTTNGSVAESKKSGNYGSNLTFNVTPAENYKYNKVTCTNGQKAGYSDGVLTIIGLTNDTVCNVEFTASKHKITLNIKNGTVNGNNPQEKLDGQSATFEIKANPGYSLSHPKINCGSFNISSVVFQGGYFTIPSVTSDITCEVELQQSATN